MTFVKPDPTLRRGIELLQSHEHRFSMSDTIPTDGVQYSAVATFGTTAVNVVNELIDPHINLQLHSIQVGLTQKFTEVASANASLSYYWQARQESVATTLGWVNITGTYQKGINAKATSEDTFSGWINVGSVPQAPFRLQLVATGLVASSMTGKLKGSSFVQIVGAVIPGA